ncbi:MAG TPA: hypothetical protein VFL85_03390 [Candidatus Saccharimonadales bacterium]|nr:hypothetical protein [Candidatus Saccharimonadales bacterium]
MKQKDIALIILIAGISGFASFFLSKVIFTTPQNRQQKAPVVDSIDTTFPQPSQKYFNTNSIDPTQLIHIGEHNNSDPFSGAQ